MTLSFPWIKISTEFPICWRIPFFRLRDPLPAFPSPSQEPSKRSNLIYASFPTIRGRTERDDVYACVHDLSSTDSCLFAFIRGCTPLSFSIYSLQLSYAWRTASLG